MVLSPIMGGAGAVGSLAADCGVRSCTVGVDTAGGAGAAGATENFSHMVFTASRTPVDVIPYSSAISLYVRPAL